MYKQMITRFISFVLCILFFQKTYSQTRVNQHNTQVRDTISKVKQLHQVSVFGQLSREEEPGSRARERHADNVTNIISSRAMERSPDINAANVLQRMSGITVQRSGGGDEAYSIIRGMEPRYNNTLVNGVKIASPDEKSRFVPLNIIPSDLLSSIEISKSLLPEMEGDAIGGTVNMIMKDAPDSLTFKATAALGYSQLFFDRRYTGFGKNEIRPLSPLQRNPPGYKAQPDDFSRSNLDFKPQWPLPTGIFGVTYTQRFLKNKLGVIIADNIQNQYYGDNSQFNGISPENQTISNKLHAIDVSNRQGSTQQMNNGLITHIDYLFNERHHINIDNLFLYSYLAQARLSNDTTLDGTGRHGPGTGQVFFNDRSLTQKEYIEHLKVSGRHLLTPSLLLDWTGIWSTAGKRAPDRATLTTDLLIRPDYTVTDRYFDGIEHIWQKNNDHDYTGMINLAWRPALGPHPLELKAGGLYRSKSRYNTQDLYDLRPPTVNGNGGATSGKPPFTDIYSAQWSVFNSAGSGAYDPNAYTADEKVTAAFLQAKWQLERLDVVGGLRWENTLQDFATSKQSITAVTAATIKYYDFLPSLNLKYRLASMQNLRLSYYKSISRPNYFELVPYTIRGLDFDERGNPYLKHTVADNFDLRYEWYPRGEEQLFAGVFYKRIQDPIELGLLDAGISGGQIYYTPQNYGTAHNYGFELAFTHYWGRIGVTGNYTYTHSAITTPKQLYYKANQNAGLPQIDSFHVNETRPLQGQSDHVVNLSLLYRDTKNGLFAQLAYGYIGRTLAEVSIYYASDYYQRPMSTLAFSIEKDVRHHLTIFGKFNNLLNTATTVEAQRTLLVAQYVYKATYSVGIRYNH